MKEGSPYMGTMVLKYYSSDEITCIVGAAVKRQVHTPPSVFLALQTRSL